MEKLSDSKHTSRGKYNPGGTTTFYDRLFWSKEEREKMLVKFREGKEKLLQKTEDDLRELFNFINDKNEEKIL
jgi:hypothetical protein